MPPSETNIDRPETRDIPDMEAKDKPTVVLPPDVQAEREVRRYINKEGVFSKDIEQYFAVFKGIDSDGKMVYEQTKTRAEAEQSVKELCEKTGRKVAADSTTGRLKATPGWNLNIRVPGMAQSEQKAAAESDAHLQARANQQQILDLRRQNEELAAQLKELTEKLTAPAETEKPKDEGRETKDEGRGTKGKPK